MSTILRQKVLNTIDTMLEEHLITKHDLGRFGIDDVDCYDPEAIRLDYEKWYLNMGIETITQEKFSLQPPFFTREEIKTLTESGEILLCVPKGLSRKVLSQLFHMPSWACEDTLISNGTEIEDFWFKMKVSERPEHLDKGGQEIKRIYEKEGKLGLSLERYLVFVNRIKYLFGEFPDTKTKTWLTNSKYEKKGMLIAGFDANVRFSVHAWMPNFHSPIVGGRYTEIVDHLYL